MVRIWVASLHQKTSTYESTLRFLLCSKAKLTGRVDSNRAALRSRVSNQPSATTTTAACGGNREELLGQRPARRECCSGHEADAGSRNPLLLLSPRVWRIGMSTKTAAPAGKTGGTCNSHTAIRNLESHERAGGFEQQRSRPPPAAKTSPGRGKMSHSDKKGNTGRRGWGSAPIFQGPAKGLQKNRQAQLVRPGALRSAGQKSPCGAFLDARLA